MSVIELNIKKPTTISAGAVAKDGIAVKIGAKNIDSANSTAAVIEVRPVPVSYTHLTLPTILLV